MPRGYKENEESNLNHASEFVLAFQERGGPLQVAWCACKAFLAGTLDDSLASEAHHQIQVFVSFDPALHHESIIFAGSFAVDSYWLALHLANRRRGKDSNEIGVRYECAANTL